MGFTKLDEGILQSSIMAESSDTFKVWIAFLASCGSDGVARVSSLFVSSVCHLSIDIVDKAISILESIDPRSRSINEDGKRLVRVDGGYRVVNYEKYRGWTYSQTPEAKRQRKHRDIDVTKSHGSVTCCDTSVSSLSYIDKDFLSFWEKYPRKESKRDAAKAWKVVAKTEDKALINKALSNYIARIKKQGTETRFIKLPATFLREERWKDYLQDAPAATKESPEDFTKKQLDALKRRG